MIDKIRYQYPQVSTDTDIQARYEELRDAGQSHSMADLLAHRKAPGAVGDTTWLAGRKLDGTQFDTTPQARKVGKLFTERAKRAGVNPKGKYYMAGLANYPGDPKAWVSNTSDALAVCKERGITASGGAFTHKAPIKELKKEGPKVNPRLVAGEVELRARNVYEETGHEIRGKELTDMAETVTKQLGGNH